VSGLCGVVFFDMYLEFVCSRIILPRFVRHALFCLLTEYDSYQELPKKTKYPRKKCQELNNF